MLRRLVLYGLVCIVMASGAVAFAQAPQPQTPQSPAPVPAGVGPQIGTPLPEFSGVDQFGRTQTLATVMGPKGAMVVFYRSADW